MSEDWYFNYAMKRASIDSYSKHIWYAIETANGKKTVHILDDENDVFNLKFNKDAEIIEVGYTPKCFCSDINEIPSSKRAVVSVYFIDGSFQSIDEATENLNTSLQELKLKNFEPNSELGILKQAISDFAIGIIKGKSKTCIARENIHKLAKLSDNGKIKDVKSIEDIANKSTATDVLNHFKTAKSATQATAKKSA